MMRTSMMGVTVALLLSCANQSSEAPWRKVDGASGEDAAEARSAATSAESVLAGGKERIRLSCEEKWPGDFSGMALCVDMQTRGFQKVQLFVMEQGIQPGDTTPEAQIFDSCFRKWRDSYGRPDWSGTGLCVDMQWRGYERLNQDDERLSDHPNPRRCAALKDDSERLACFDSLAAGGRGVGAASNAGMWEVFEETNPLDDSMAVVLALKASGDWSILRPPVVLILRCVGGETEVYVDWRQSLGFEDEEVDVVSRVGSAKAATQRWALSSDTEATFFLGNTQALIECLMMEGRFVAQLEPPNSNPITAVFELHGIDTAVAPLRRACGW